MKIKNQYKNLTNKINIDKFNRNFITLRLIRLLKCRFNVMEFDD